MRHDHVGNTTPPSSSDPLQYDFGEVFSLLAKHKTTIAGLVAAAIAIAGIFLLVTPTRYSATAVLLIDSRNNTLPSQQLRVTDANSESAYVETQVGVLKSERVARAVIVDQKLHEQPEFRSSAGWFSTKPAEPPSTGEPDSAIGTVPASAVREFGRRTSIKRSQSTFLIEIGFTHTDPKVAANIANAIARTYMNDRYVSREKAIAGLSQWLQVRALDLRRETQAAETALDEFRTSNQSTSGGRGMLRDLESTAQTYRAISESFLKRFLETSQEQYFSPIDARVVSEAWPPGEGSYPKKSLVLTIAAATGLAIGFLVALVRGHADRRRALRDAFGVSNTDVAVRSKIDA